jgi:hypothetical protein
MSWRVDHKNCYNLQSSAGTHSLALSKDVTWRRPRDGLIVRGRNRALSTASGDPVHQNVQRFAPTVLHAYLCAVIETFLKLTPILRWACALAFLCLCCTQSHSVPLNF